MNVKLLLGSLALAGLVAYAVPSAPVLANGAASTRNILLLGGAAATYLIVAHNRKVHEQRAAAAARAAAVEQRSSDAWAAYRQEQHAYSEEVAVNRELQGELAYQRRLLAHQQQQLATTTVNGWGQL